MIGFKVHFFWWPVGPGSYLHSFFSTISYHLEQNGWGTKYPYLMKHAYMGKVEKSLIEDFTLEVKEVYSLLKNYSSEKIIWDIEDLSKQPLQGLKTPHPNLSLADYFVTSDGDNLFEALLLALEKAKKFNVDFEIGSL